MSARRFFLTLWALIRERHRTPTRRYPIHTVSR